MAVSHSENPDCVVASTSKKLDFLWISLLFFTILLFACDQITRKFSLNGFSPLWSATLAFSIASPSLLLNMIIKKERVSAVNQTEWNQHFISAAIFTVMNVLGFYGVSFTLASRAGLFLFSYPIFVTIFGLFVPYGSALTKNKLIGMLLSFLGVAGIFYSRDILSLSYLKGDLLVLASAVFVGLLILHQKKLSQNVKPMKIIFWQITLSLPFFWAAALYINPLTSLPMDIKSWIPVIFQGLLINNIALTCRAILVKHFDAGMISSYFFVTPVFTVILANLLLDDPITSNIIFGSVLIALGVYLINKSKNIKE